MVGFACGVVVMAVSFQVVNVLNRVIDRREYRGRRLAALKHLRAVYGAAYRGDGFRCRGTTLARGYAARKRSGLV